MSKIDIVNEIHKNVRIHFPRRHVIMKDIDDLWQADLIDMQAFSKTNSNMKYILVIIDTFSKYAWAYPLKNKSKEQVCNVFNKLLGEGRVPKNLQTDQGTEFYNNKFKYIIKKYGINHYSTFSTKKASIVERFIRTIKSKMYKLFSLKGNYKWYDATLKKIIHEYNHTYHKTIAQKPSEVNENNIKSLQERYARVHSETIGKQKRRKLQVGDNVRISKYKGTFDKGYTPNWSTEIFKIVRVNITDPVTYFIEDARHNPILGAFYGQELQKTNQSNLYLVEKIIKRKGNKYLVKWLGLPVTENTWINSSDIVH